MVTWSEKPFSEVLNNVHTCGPCARIGDPHQYRVIHRCTSILSWLATKSAQFRHIKFIWGGELESHVSPDVEMLKNGWERCMAVVIMMGECTGDPMIMEEGDGRMKVGDTKYLHDYASANLEGCLS